jgi:hypothetical protein
MLFLVSVIPSRYGSLNPQLQNGPVDDDRGIRSNIPAKEAAGLLAVIVCLLALYWFSAFR